VSTTFRGTWLLLAACAACSRSGSTTRSEPGASPQAATSVASGRRDRNVITRDELADPSLSGRNVLEVVRLLRPQFLTVRGTHTLQDTSTARRGMVDPEAGKVHASIDGTKIVSIDELASIPASSVMEIRFLTPAQAMQRFGGAAREGPVILVTTT
jgi:hypothetical protein